MVAFVIALLTVGNTPAIAQGPRDQARTAIDSGNFEGAARLYAEALKQSPNDKDILVEAGDVHMELENYQTARDIYKQALDLDRKNPAINRKYGGALSKTGDHPRAIQVLQDALAYDKQSVEGYLALGQGYIDAGKDSLSRAELMFNTANAKYPNNARIAVASGDLQFERGFYPIAQEKYEEALSLDPTLIEPRIRLGRTYRQLAIQVANEQGLDSAQQWYNKALFEFNNVTGRAPKQARPWTEQGEILMLAGEYEKALQSYGEYVRLRPDDPRGDIMLGRAAYNGTFFREAVAPLERVLAKEDSLSRGFAVEAGKMLGKSYFADKKFPEAVRAYARVPEDSIFGDNDASQFYAASLMNLKSNADTLKALGVYRKIAEANPTDCKLSGQLGDLLYTMKRYDEVIDVFSKRFMSCPDEPKTTPYLFIGLSHYTKQRYDNAIDALHRSIAADSSNEQAIYWLMNAYATKKQFGKAKEIAQMMIARGLDKTQPKWVATGFFFGGVERFQKKDFKGTIPEMERALRYNSEYSDAYLYIAYSYQSMNDKDNACKYYKMVIRYGGANAKTAQTNMKSIGCQ